VLDHHNDLERGTGSSRALAAGRAWLKSCRETHPRCRRLHDVTDPVLPTRVLDVACGTQQNPAVRLVETRGVQRGAYCALSYCWGQTHGTTTTKANLEEHKRHIPVEALPATIQDAITATRGLGFLWLWVDSLCIVQDDPNDWESEAAKMGEVYVNASMTISTMFGSDCGEKLFTPRVIRQPNPLPLPIATRQYTRNTQRVVPAVHPPLERDWQDLVKLSSRGPIHSRGWTLQEQLLSTRILWFGHGHVQWECLSVCASEPAPKSEPKSDWHHGSTGYATGLERSDFLVKLDLAAPQAQPQQFGSNILGDNGVSDAYSTWERLVAEYTTRKLTKESDRIPAILGLANMMRPVFQCEFIIGTWNGDYFLRSLLWRVKDRTSTASSPPSSNSLYPSWTWASRPGIAIDYHLARDTDSGGSSWLARLISMDVNVKGKSQNSATGSITLIGPLGKMTTSEVERLQRGQTDMIIGIFGRPEYHPDTMLATPGPGSAATMTALRGSWYLDIEKFDPGPPSKGYGLRRWSGRTPGGTVRLFLEPVDNRTPPLVFRRVGIGRLSWDAQDVTVREITIV